MTSDDAPRGKIYKLPSGTGQVATVMMGQMRLYAKSKLTWIFIFLALLIPILAYGGTAEGILDAFGMPASTSYLLILLPLFLPVIPAMIGGRVISSEFKNRTVYQIFPLPLSRTSFFFGKFLAAFVLSIGIFSLAYGFAIFCGSNLYAPSYPNDALNSFIVTITGVFAFSAMACGLSPYFKRGSAGLIIAIMIFLPMVLSILLEVYVPDKTDLLWNLKVLPPFSGYQALQMIDALVGGFLSSMFDALVGTYDTYKYIVASVLWGALFLGIGLARVKGKEL